MKTSKTNSSLRELALIAAPFVLSVAAFAQQPPTAEELEFFETKIRPVLIEACYKCHSADSEKVKGGLYVDSKEGLIKGGSSGPAIAPGNAERSLFIKAIRYSDPNLTMPPKEKLSADKIADLEAWVKMGAPDPRTGKKGNVLKNDKDKDKAKKHWAFQPIKKPEVPTPKSHLKTWIQNPIDTFVLAKMEEKGLLPSPPADRWTLIRRAYFDLIGLPPSPEAVEKFLTDESPEAWSNVIDELLASPQYGERWARYWLDVARYADTRGGNNNANRMMGNRMVYSFTYRDYVVNAYNEDLPYDQFLIQQIAADKIPGVDKKALAGMGLLTLNRAANPQDIIDDRIDVLCRGMMSLGVYCARCHDHKFDPIPTKDYYSLAGVFLSSEEKSDKPVIENPDLNPDYAAYVKAVNLAEADLEAYKRGALGKALGEARAKMAEYMIAVVDYQKENDFKSRADQDAFRRQYKLDPLVAIEWARYLKGHDKESDAIFGPWAAYAKLNDKEFATKGKEFAVRYAANDTAEKKVKLNALVARAFSTPASSMRIVAERYGKLFGDADRTWNSTMELYRKRVAMAKEDKPEEPKGIADPVLDEIRKAILAGKTPVNFDYATLARRNNNAIQNGEGAYYAKIEQINIEHPGSPKRAMALTDGTLRNARVMIKGSPQNLGDEVPRQFLEILSGPDRKPFKNGSGRLELAQAIASKDNPLTARVLINRVWANHFGAPLVRTPTDFGVRADDPTHPEMLDWMASWFIENGWSVKKLHKLIMMSNIYQQSSDDRAKAGIADPANMMVWKMNRRRLDFEAFRDSLLTVSGKLDLTMGGQPVNLMNVTDEKEYTRRTIYGFINRGNLAAVFRTFDFANPDSTQGQRFNSTVPQQALFMMNSPFVTALARGMVARTDFKTEIDEDQRINKLYQLAFQRAPSPTELKLSKYFLEVQSGVKGGGEAKPVWQYGFGEYSDATKKMLRFNPLQNFTGKTWQGGPTLPDARFAMLHLTSDGGYPGVIKGLSVIRRWTAPKDCSVSIDGTLGHKAAKGSDGVQGVIVSSRTGELGRYLANGKTLPTAVAKVEVKKGDSIDFVVDCRADSRNDAFTWAPVIKVLGAPPAMMAGRMADASATGEVNEWRAAVDFNPSRNSAPKPLGTWEKYAQVLLLSNELSFVD